MPPMPLGPVGAPPELAIGNGYRPDGNYSFDRFSGGA
jgi:hypothetical protein